MLGKLYEARKNTKGAADGFRGNQYTEVVNPENQELPKSKNTSREIAKEHGVSHSTVEEAGNYAKGLDEAEKVSPGIREKVLSGEVKAPKSVQHMHNKYVKPYCKMCKSVLLYTRAKREREYLPV